MAAYARRWLVLVLAGAAVLSGGCDLGSLAYFLMPEPRQPALFKDLASADAKKDPRVVILTYTALETRAEFIQADRQLAEMLAKQLTEAAKGNQEKLTVVPPRRVEEYKNTHPSWREQDLPQLGKAFDADYVIYLEINKLSLYERGSSELFRGRASLSVNLIDVRHPDDTPRSDAFWCVYPSGAHGPVQAFDTQPMQFRQEFLSHVAQRLTRYFARYPKRDSLFVGGPDSDRSDW
jgi:hypothetical protein